MTIIHHIIHHSSSEFYTISLRAAKKFSSCNLSLEALNLLWLQDTIYCLCKSHWKVTRKSHNRWKSLRCVTVNVKKKSRYKYLGFFFLFMLGNSQITILPDNNALRYINIQILRLTCYTDHNQTERPLLQRSSTSLTTEKPTQFSLFFSCSSLKQQISFFAEIDAEWLNRNLHLVSIELPHVLEKEKSNMPFSCLEGRATTVYFCVSLFLDNLDSKWQEKLEILVLEQYQE